MKKLRNSLSVKLGSETRQLTELVVDSKYAKYIAIYNKNDVSCVGWLDGKQNAEIRFRQIYAVGINNNDSVLDVGCGVAHLNLYLQQQGWHGKYLGFDPNKFAIDLIDKQIDAIHCNIDDIDKTQKWDWTIASGVFNLGLKDVHTFWIIEEMISLANKGVIFNMLLAPYADDTYEAYDPKVVKQKLQKFEHKKIEIFQDYMDDNTEFTVCFEKV